jgi:hypothetical protein
MATRQRSDSQRHPAGRSFVHRGGTRLAGTVVACDANAGGGDLLFLSHARAHAPAHRQPEAQGEVNSHERARRERWRPGRGQVLATTETLALLGD